jgi:ribosomal protein L11 methyltransferase
MEYLRITISAAPESLGAISDRLTALGLDEFEIEEEGSLPVFGENGGASRVLPKGVSQIILHVENNASGRAVLKALPAELEELKKARPDICFGALEILGEVVESGGWENEWKKHYKPFKVGKRLYVRPAWEEPLPDKKGRVVYISNPGQAFGNGTHESTRLCMIALEECIAGGESVLDLGCGSGILSIISLLLGARNAVGVDLDEAALHVSTENARQNGVSDRCVFLHGDVLENDAPLGTALTATRGENGNFALPPDGFDIVCANIVADTIIKISGKIGKYLKSKGRLIASGIIEERLPEVKSALEGAGFCEIKVMRENGWCALIAQKT